MSTHYYGKYEPFSAGVLSTGALVLKMLHWEGRLESKLSLVGPCRGVPMSILRNANVVCLCRLFIPMSPFKFKK